MNGKSINLFSRDEFFEKVLRRSGSTQSHKVARTSINALDAFCLETFEKNTGEIMQDIRQNISYDANDASAMMFLDKFSAFLQKSGKSSSTVKGYVGFSKKYLRQCGGIRISGEDMQDYVTLPINSEEEDLEPMTKDQLRLLIENTPNSRRKAFYMMMKDTACRAKEALQIRKKHIDLEKNIVTLPRNITKGKKRKRTQRITHETNKILQGVLEKLQDDDYLSQSNKGNVDIAYMTEYHAFDRVRTKAGLNEKYDSGRFKKNMHSIRSFCYTQCKLATGDADYAHGHIGHDRYLAVYERLEEKEQVELFNRCAPRLSLFEDVVVLSEDGANEKIDSQQKQIDFLKQQLEEVQQGIKDQQKHPKTVLMTNLPDLEN